MTSDDDEHEHDGGRPDFVGAPRCERLRFGVLRASEYLSGLWVEGFQADARGQAVAFDFPPSLAQDLGVTAEGCANGRDC